MMLRFRAAIALCFLLQGLLALPKKLTDETFEHLTQASTGMTTGSWVVLFRAKTCETCDAFEEVLENAEEELRESYVLPAVVHQEDSPGLWKRFRIGEVPTVLLLAKHKLYRFGQDNLDVLNSVRRALDGELVGEEIPAEPSFVEILMQKVKGLFGGGGEL
eukprot:TRINITY_DN27575_c0_g2_i1.p1 TRINITY_DN27575_c0_g2~~TRINITY_DN27575_c0_g2_i1.p1  ORF type:complete len:161 (+),score=35.05 TRINITY_DN27575_c0_g2_i1:92-574(+)